MSNLPQVPGPGNPVPRSYDPSRWIDLIAFLAVLALGGVLIALRSTTAGSLAAICAALGGLYGIWKRARSPRKAPDAPDADEPDGSESILATHSYPSRTSSASRARPSQ